MARATRVHQKQLKLKCEKMHDEEDETTYAEIDEEKICEAEQRRITKKLAKGSGSKDLAHVQRCTASKSEKMCAYEPQQKRRGGFWNRTHGQEERRQQA
eukprot:561695-Pleurochrysis_carterae.AAC.3